MNQGISVALRSRLEQVRSREDERFRHRTPASRDWLASAAASMPDGVPMAWMRGLYRHLPVVAVSGRGSSFDDLDGNTYLDFNLADLSMAAGYSPAPIMAALAEQAGCGLQFLLPTDEALQTARQLAQRFPLSHWQFTVSASGANTDALRVARAYTGRQHIVMFDGKYHGHLDATMWSPNSDGGLISEGSGIDASSATASSVLTYNDVAALEARLEANDVAAVIVEPALTNCGLVLPQPDFVAALNTAVRRNGALLIVDETHTQFAVYGGGTQAFAYQPDLITGGKGIAGGVPIGFFGMSEPLSAFMESHRANDPGVVVSGDSEGVATGGTLYGNALSMSCAFAGLRDVFTADAAAEVDRLGAVLQHQLQSLVDDVALPWTIDRFGGRLQWRLPPHAPLTGAEGADSIDLQLADTRKVYFANRGVWDAIASAGPSVSYAANAADVDRYADIAREFLQELTQ